MTDNGRQPPDQQLNQQRQQQPHPAYCEEFSEEAQATVPETRQSANIAPKRSKPSEHSKAKKPMRDEFSDSGYSSHTYGTLNSSLDSKLDNAPSGASGATIHNAIVPFAGEPDVIKNRAQSPEKDVAAGAPKRSRSKHRRDGGASARRRECGCDQCRAAARPTHLLVDPYRTSTRPSAQPPPRHRTPAPPSPQSRRTPQIAMPLREHTRSRPSASSRPRPVSYHGGAAPDPRYVPVQPTYLLDHAPDARQTAYPFLQPSYPPQPTFYQAAPPPAPAPPPPPAPQDYFQPMQPHLYEIQPQMVPPPRPPTRQWTSERPPSRPQSMFYAPPPPQPVYDYEYGEDPIYTGMIDPQPQQQSLEHSLSRRDPYSSLREAYTGRPYVPSSEDSRRMPPPPPPPPKIRPEPRPQIRHAATAAPTVYADPQSVSHDQPRQSRKPSFDSSPPPRSRRPSLARPSLRTSEDKNVSFDSLERGIHSLKLEPIPTNTASNSSSKSRRRSSVYGGHGDSVLRELEGDVEAYQATQRLRSNTNTSNSATPISPLATNEDILSRVPLGTRKKTDSSETGSRASQRSGGSGSGLRARRPSNNDVGSTSSRENKEGRDSNTGNVALRFNPEGVNVKMQGGIDGRAINLRKSKDGDKGDLELSIGSKDESKSDRRKQLTAAHQQTERTVPALSGAPTVRQIEHSTHQHHQQERRGRETPVSVGSRPSLAGRERSRRRYSYVEGGSGGVREVHHEEGGYAITRIGSRDPYQAVADDSGARMASKDRSGNGGRPSDYAMVRTGSGGLRDEEYRGAGGARIIGERIVTTMRSRRSSRYSYD
ncbi:MAG: hypothetical protein OHK93_008337 [Ramalina farinacea]|uniref:Uncharacterized protein n=1 Tax=Ramalina farinacea TaxID=258253 RepID=A0AA43TV73_9LECA|nr:hypothetical protein [Ramalina farinacea]